MKTALSSKFFIAVAFVLVGLLLFFWLGGDLGARDIVAPSSSRPAQSERQPAVSSARRTIRVAPLRRTRPLVEGAFTPQEVIGNLDCRFRAGWGNAAGRGLVLLPEEGGARFEVLDGEGRIFGDALPFVPNHYQLTRQTDGSVLTGFGDLRLNSPVSRPEVTPEPVRIYRDGRMIYETEKAWNFGLAPDGSAFFVVEPMAGMASRLVIHNLNLGREYHQDLGYAYTPSFDELRYGIRFTADSAEVMMFPLLVTGGKSHIFFPANGENRRQITLEGRGAAVFESMHRGYYASPQGKNEPWLIQKKEFRWADQSGSPGTMDVWSQEINLEHFSETMRLSNDGAWLILNAWVIQVLDTQTGKTVFTWPHAMPYDEEQLARLSTVLPPDATIADVGGVGSVNIFDGQLLLYRKVQRAARRFSYSFDVFDMTGIVPDSKPNFRIPVSWGDRCLEGDFALRGLQDVDGALTYLTEKRGSHKSPSGVGD